MLELTTNGIISLVSLAFLIAIPFVSDALFRKIGINSRRDKVLKRARKEKLLTSL